MTKQKLSSKEVRARSLAYYELEKFFGYILTIDPTMRSDEVIVLAAFILEGLPQLFQQNPALLDQVKEIATNMKLKRGTHNSRN
ncbi:MULTISPECIES: hypothetical protein [unclassified Nostoc]|uniref:hypothetical protein n=1 Tax=unclassified Nostoc TaxID=2593658 RepID=UPI002AD34E88|nr:hypothetical protein [Nostoc sp. DedQUE03]MDZ7974036.1 hypothetical protein [Nostoc sp. DedQUE03]MDZ8048537.1 hypothetical protein [Nostoc sp. DedQUE02]